MTIRPLLFLDVDGPLNPVRSQAVPPPGRIRDTSHEPPDGPRRAVDHAVRQKPMRVWLNPTHGSHLTALPFDLVWATTWAAEANEWIAPHIGLPSCRSWSGRPGRSGR
jgi:hypothetical protein